LTLELLTKAYRLRSTVQKVILDTNGQQLIVYTLSKYIMKQSKLLSRGGGYFVGTVDQGL